MILKGIKDKGLEELNSFKSRVYKSRGMNRIDAEDFQRLISEVNELIEDVKSIEEKR